ncbi:hypothetical protein BU23DRAFT_595780 [Bimuria novae-zelandiae CBS 107.79]|uniref:Uncharacterized protein n=1 Tax=Bimuria novae-zelandiae CBS 107.79 TaxID=1447943 RepID=A0A6A5VP06_9PLEO|nr:hypothetical protein BU23DRAFT_595780 [Bimuria novae-zelandiae CBS 107.79]
MACGTSTLLYLRWRAGRYAYIIFAPTPTAYLSGMALDIKNPSDLKCFKAQGPQGRSAKVLAKAGVWVGYAAPEKHELSFQGLPSFKKLKANCKNMSPPFPPMAPGEADNVVRYAACRSCYGETSPIVELREIQIMKRPPTFTIIPLHAKDDNGDLFCILLPQPNDRSLQGLEAFRPYDIGNGKAFTSYFELLSPRNRSFVNTKEEALHALGILAESTVVPTPRPSPSLSKKSPEKPLPHRKMNSMISHPKKKTSEAIEAKEPQNKRQASGATTAHMQARTPISREDSYAAPETPSGLDRSAVLSTLSEEQAKRVLLVWIVNVVDVEYEFSHSVYACPTFCDFLKNTLADASGDPEVIHMIDKTSSWRFIYQAPGETKKAFTVRVYNKSEGTGYERLVYSIAQSTIW